MRTRTEDEEKDQGRINASTIQSNRYHRNIYNGSQRINGV